MFDRYLLLSCFKFDVGWLHNMDRKYDQRKKITLKSQQQSANNGIGK